MATTGTKLLSKLNKEELDILAQGCCDEVISSALERRHLESPVFSNAVVESAGEQDFPDLNYYADNVRFFKIEEITFDTDEKIHLPGVESVLSSMRNHGVSLVFLVRGTKYKTSVYLGISKFFDEAVDVANAYSSYRAAWSAYFPGQKSEPVNVEDMRDVAKGICCDLPHVGILTGIPALKREENENLFCQGLERLIRAMRGKSYCWMSIADPIPHDELRNVLSACRALQADVHRLVKTDLSKTKSFGKSVMFGGFMMSGSGETSTVTMSKTVHCGDTWWEDFVIRGLGGLPLIGETLERWIAGKGPLTISTGVSESIQSAIANFASLSVTFTDTTTVGQEILNRKAEHAEEVLKAYEERLLNGVALGMWNLGHYFLASDSDTYNQGAGVVHSLFSGMESKYEPPRAIKMSSDFGKIISRFRNVYVRFPNLDDKEFSDHPLGIFFNGPGTPVNTRELAIATPIATQDIEGVTVSKRPSFGLNIVSRDVSGENSIELGSVLDKGNVTEQTYRLMLENFPKHLAIFGLTGSGKTNTNHCLLTRAWRKRKIPFLVIEPAKAEYRSLGRDNDLKDDLLVFSAGADTTDVCPLRLNPFDFDPGEDCDARRVHVLTHIDRLKATFNASFPMYASMPYILEEAILEIYRDRGWDLGASKNKYVDIYSEDFRDYIPTLRDLYNKIDPVMDRKGYFTEQRMNIGAALKARISSLMVGAKGTMFNCKRSIPAKDLFSKPAVIELENMGDDDEKAFLMGLLVSRLYEYRKANFKNDSGNAQLKHLLVIEEAHRLLQNIPESAATMEIANVKGKSVSAFVDMLSEIRAMGQAVIVVDQLPSRVSPNIVKGTGTKIVHRLLAKDDRECVGETMGLSDEQIADLCLLRTGECVVSQDGDSKAYMCKIKKNKTHDGREGGEVSCATSKYKNEFEALFTTCNPNVNLEDPRFKNDLYKVMLAIGLGDNATELLGKIAPSGRFSSEWQECRSDWFDTYWSHICSEIWAYYGGNYRKLLELKSCGTSLLDAYCEGDFAGISLPEDSYRRAFEEYYRESKVYWDCLSAGDSVGITAYKHLNLFTILNEQLDDLRDVGPELKIRRLALGIARVLSGLAPRGSSLASGIRKQLTREILDEIPSAISFEDVWKYISESEGK